MPRNTPYPLFQMTKPKTIKTVLGARGPMEKDDIRKLMVRNTGVRALQLLQPVRTLGD